MNLLTHWTSKLIIGGFIMARKVANQIDKQVPPLDVATLPETEGEATVTLPVIEAESKAEPKAQPEVQAEAGTKARANAGARTRAKSKALDAELPIIESETIALPVIKAEIAPPSAEGDKDQQGVKALALRVVELEDKYLKLQAELVALVEKKKDKKKDKQDKKDKKDKQKKSDV